MINFTPTKLLKSDFSIIKGNDFYDLSLSDSIEYVVVLNKILNIKKDIAISFYAKPTEYSVQKLINHIEWLGTVKDELINFYNNNSIDYKLNNVNQKWYDNLEVYSLAIDYDKENKLNTDIIIYDGLYDGYGFRLEIEDKIIKSIFYDPQL